MLRVVTKVGFFLSFGFFLIVLTSFNAYAETNCWSYDQDQPSCESNDDCQWKEDPWGGWCEQKECWSAWTQSSCDNANNASSSNFINKTCQWSTSSSSGWCNEVNCWSLAGTNASACVNNTAGLKCEWEDVYDSSNQDYPCVGPLEKQCWTYANSSACSDVSGCKWGECFEAGCWDQETSAECTAATGSNGQSCQWDSQYSYCYESGCWDYSTRSTCETGNCTWSSGYCSDKYCSDFSFTNASACVNNTASLNCDWDGNYCNEKGCWNYNSQNDCNAQTSLCMWETQEDAGWCEEVQCWSFGNSSSCVNNTASLNCIWDNTWNNCYENVSSKTCGDFSSERDCLDSYYCFWEYGNSTCRDPSEVGGIGSDFSEWNPKCYIFDYNQTDCEKVLGCSWGSNECQSNTTIEANGLGCGNVNDSSMCNSIPALSTCCVWQGGTCAEDRFTTACWDQMETPPEGAAFCEDYNAYTDQSLCNQIAGSPWFMPCKWNNGTERCEANHDKLFDNGKENLIFIDNKQNCEFAGGQWTTESYCEGSIAVSTGRCEPKFDDGANCDRACFACEYKTDGTNWTSISKAKNACIGSKVGFCGFTEDSGAENGFGHCNVKDEAKNIIGGNSCDDDCGTCTYMGDATADSQQNRPSQYCMNSKKGCKWIPDSTHPTDESKGRCASESEKTCEDKCDKCNEQSSCTSDGAKKGDSSLSAQCSWDTNTNICKPKSGASEMEICWDGVDNNNDGKTDCADSMCFSDPFCGGGFMGSNQDCFGYADQTSCASSNCTWVDEQWGSWCDVPGAACWKNDGTNQTFCESQGCEWHTGGGGFCEENWDDNEFNSCFNAQNTSSCTGNCTWVVDDWCQNVGGWCESDPSYSGAWVDCWQLYGQPGQEDSTGCAANTACRWQQDSWCQTQGAGAGWCDHKKFVCWQYNSIGSCENSSNGNDQWCDWKSDEWGSWCDSNFEASGSCWDQNDESSCTTSGCEWVSGLCDPPGFGGSGGGGTSSGMNCYVYDGNQTGCESSSGCGWFTEGQPFCDIDFSSDCPQYGWNQTLCQSDASCQWNNFGSFCEEKVSSCWQIGTDIDCDAQEHCSWDSNMHSCEPSCFSAATENACGAININGTGTKACRWINGWCGGAMQAGFFKDMEGGAPIELGSDAAGDASPSEIDIVGFGMKDMGDAYGFGIGVADVRDGALCNDIKMQSGTGTGKNTTKFYFYLDTDGTRTGSCAMAHDSSTEGYEFYFTFEASYDQQSGNVDETYQAYRCSSGSFVVTDIKVSGFRQLMCSEINGGMIAIDKSDLEKYPSLYTAGEDIRVAVATANASGNVTNPTDTATAGFATPGAVDFDFDNLDMFKVGNTSNFGADTANLGYVEYKSDCWTQAGCADYSCYNHPYCVANSYGVHAAGFEDTRTPKIIVVMKESYPDSTLVRYFTDKPANGTLFFYSNDSTCNTLNATIYDRGITSSDMRAYRLPHVAEVYNANIGYNLAENTQYYFKVQVCDDAGKCGISKCSSFVTESTGDCAFCKFVSRLQAPTGWNVSFDLDQDGVYEHAQGQVCGAKAGMKTNYTSGRRANIKLTKGDNSTWLEFKNVSITKTGMGRKIQDIKDNNSLAASTTTDSSGNTIGYAGMISGTRDKIVNNLYPEKCFVKIPGTGTCSELWHCNDALTTCVDRTSEATLTETGSDYCIWQIPYCEFSNWAGGQPGTPSSSNSPSSSSGGGGGGGGGGSAVNSTSKVSLFFSSIPVGVTTVDIEGSGGTGLAFTKNTITVNTNATNVDLTFEVKEDVDTSQQITNVYQYVRATTTLDDSQIDSVRIEFKVPLSWTNDNSISEVVLKRYTTQWDDLDTQYLRGDGTYKYYRATSPGYSLFAVVGIPSTAAPASETTAEQPPESSPNQVESDSTGDSGPTGAATAGIGGNAKITGIAWILGILVIGVVIAVGVHHHEHRQQKNKRGPRTRQLRDMYK